MAALAEPGFVKENCGVSNSSPSATRSDSATPESAAPESALPFEDCVRRLGQIVESLEHGDLPLEESLRLFEEGVRLARASQAQLDAAERRVEQLLGLDAEGNPIVREVEMESS
jgi:exodeoxyribonuclease VII small subunit